jgi:peptidoglycan/xylan/chitin deacetylase (PgdA/CDA1 family)
MSMAQPRTVFLMYHELELPDRPLCQSEPGYLRYILSAHDFLAQMERLKMADWRGVSITSALGFEDTQSVAITFDDGCESDLLTAAPMLRKLDFGATFYVTAGFLGRRGYMSPAQLRELSNLGFEIGCHSMTHAYLSDLDDAGLQREIAEAKLQLEQIIGKPVEHFSCPGGRYNRRVVEIVREAGYRSMATSRAHANSPSTDAFELGRIPVMRETTLNTFEELYRGDALWRITMQNAVRNTAKRLLGNSLYDRIRSFMLHRKSSAKRRSTSQ